MLGVPSRLLVIYISVIIAIFACHSYFSVILGGGSGKNGSTIAVSSSIHIRKFKMLITFWSMSKEYKGI